MDTKPVNPLVKHFRQPAIYLKLPSGGQYWPEDAINLPVNGEIPVYPMTTRDEITLKTPDALINGSGVVNVIQSCCPNILDAWRMPSVDVDAVIIAIRIASYGTNMQFTSKCPKCSAFNDYGLNLQESLARIRMPDYSKFILTDKLKIKLHPQPYFELNQSNQLQFEQQKLIQAIQATEMSDDLRSVEIQKHMNTIINLNIKNMTSCTEFIQTDEDTRVTDKSHIEEFYSNCGSIVTKKINDRLTELVKEGNVPPLGVNCSDCGHPFSIEVTFDFASFFVEGF